MKITTKKGDKGTTRIYGSRRVSKCDLRIEAEGTLDEAISSLGLAKTKVRKAPIKEIIGDIQKDLFKITAEIAREKKDISKLKRRISADDVERLEKIGDMIEKGMKVSSCFVIPGVNEGSASLHIARTVVRRAERVVTALNKKTKINPQILAYLNRLSDLLFILARNEEGKPDSLKYE